MKSRRIIEAEVGGYDMQPRGQRCLLTLNSSDDGSEFSLRKKTYPCVVSRNTRVDEKPWRITVFGDDLTPLDHFDFEEFDGNLSTILNDPTFERFQREIAAAYPEDTTLTPL